MDLEEELQKRVIKLAKVFQYLHFHDYDSRKNPAGFPDLVLVKPPRVLFVELKRNKKDRLNEKQFHWANYLLGCPGIEYYIWSPEHWRDGEIEKVLNGKSTRGNDIHNRTRG